VKAKVWMIIIPNMMKSFKLIITLNVVKLRWFSDGFQPEVVCKRSNYAEWLLIKGEESRKLSIAKIIVELFWMRMRKSCECRIWFHRSNLTYSVGVIKRMLSCSLIWVRDKLCASSGWFEKKCSVKLDEKYYCWIKYPRKNRGGAWSV
jgi:hypothetical protein